MRSFAHLTAQMHQQCTRANRVHENEDRSPPPSVTFRNVSWPSLVVLQPFDPIPFHTERSGHGAPFEGHDHNEQLSRLWQRMLGYVENIQEETILHQKLAGRRSASLASTPIGQIGPLKPEVEPSTTLVQ